MGRDEGSYRSVGGILKLFRTGNTPASGSRVVRTFLTRYKKEGGEGEERDAAKLLTFLYDRAPGIASTCNANPLCMFPARIRLCSFPIVLPRLVLSMVLIRHSRFENENGTRNVRNRIDLSSLFSLLFFFFFLHEKKLPCKSAITRDRTGLIRAIYKLDD